MTTLTAARPRKLEVKDFKADVAPDWCPGCGDFGVLNVLQKACAELEIQPHELLVVSGIGCSSNLPGFFRSYGVHSLHGRALPFATGAKLANHHLTVIATGGDGDGYGIGLNHFIQAMRRNINLTYIVMNNEIYGLTTGQTSPTSEHGMVTKSTPQGNLEQHAQSAGPGPGLRLRLHRPRLQRRSQAPAQTVHGRHPVSGIRPDRRVQPVRDVQQAEHLSLVPRSRLSSGGQGPRSGELPGGDGPRDGMGREDSDWLVLSQSQSASVAGSTRSGACRMARSSPSRAA